jgi:DNA invertase Pin-like site-specific DNA recombinase
MTTHDPTSTRETTSGSVTRAGIRAASYLRVSTKAQAARSGLIRQREQAHEHANAHGLEIVGEYVDVASGAVAFRPGLRDLLAAVDAGAVDVVLVEADDRLSRDVAHSTALMERLRLAGVAVQETCPLVRECGQLLRDIVADFLSAACAEAARGR